MGEAQILFETGAAIGARDTAGRGNAPRRLTARTTKVGVFISHPHSGGEPEMDAYYPDRTGGSRFPDGWRKNERSGGLNRAPSAPVGQNGLIALERISGSSSLR
jgi:hypothetical protein